MPRTPVVFVPGLGGSFNLMTLLDWRGPSISGWDFPPFLDYGKTFIDTFQRAGYTRDVNLFVAFYDWRKSVSDSATNYLIPWIDRARSRSSQNKVILVGHSMGGLVSRSYIQSAAYAARNDVERLITLGTPHRGAPEAYYPWEGGELRWDPTVNAVLRVYLWYLEHIHPFQTGLDTLRTIRTQAPGIRDLLSLDNYLTTQGPPPASKAVATMLHRNLWGDLALTPAGLATLLARTPLSTISGTGFVTVQGLVVQPPPPATANPPYYVDGTPVEQQTTGSGDGTVLLTSARIEDARVRNLSPVTIAHDQLPDKAVALVLNELGIPMPAAAAATPGQPRLVIMTASPVELVVEPPAPQPAVLGAEERQARRQPRVRGRNYGHKGKRLNIAVIPQPAIGTYNIRLRGTAAGSFALGAFIVGVQTTAVLGADDADALEQPVSTPIDTASGQVQAQTELLYQIVCRSYAAPPEVRFDAAATARNAVTRLRDATQARPAVLGVEESGPQVQGVLSTAEAPDDLRATIRAALIDGDAGAIEELVSLMARAEPATMGLLSEITQQVVGVKNEELALGLLGQLRQVAQIE
ncbi:MAG TPA: permease [Roseiflexaceae bacterium]|nr:permease [Roseiflexaceae bacterium]